MKIKNIAIALSLAFSTQAFAVDSNSCADYSNGKCTYNATNAVLYALKHYDNRDNIRRNSDSGNTFPYYQVYQFNEKTQQWEWTDNNCTNFASQVIMAGLVGTSSKSTIWNKKNAFVDKGGKVEWYFEDSNNDLVGDAWNGAHTMYNYAKGNRSSWKGLHFDFVAEDSLTEYLDVSKIKVGDIVFVNWDAEKDKIIDHVMVVTDIDRWWVGNDYNEIQVTYQSNDRKDVRLGALNEQYNHNATFHVYRPTDFNDNGL